MILISFDIDGTLEVGDPPGIITLDVVRRAKSLGYLVGSASDRVMSEQSRMWATHRIVVDFVGHKHRFDEVKAQFLQATRFIHIGDTDVDRRYAEMFGFEFYWPDGLPEEGAAGWVF